MPLSCISHSPIEEMIHGVPLTDPCRWLEDRSLPEIDDPAAGSFLGSLVHSSSTRHGLLRTFRSSSKWRSEYGSVVNVAEFHALLRYSPYHRVRRNIDYPSVLFVTGDNDDQCNPAHVRKMAALFQERAAQHYPVLVDHSAERGHSPVLPLSVRVPAGSSFCVENLEFRFQRRNEMKRLVAEGFLLLLGTEFLMFARGFPALHAWVQGRAIGRATRLQTDVICHAMDVACVFYPKRVLCLQRSVSTAIFLRRHGIPAEMVIGAQMLPFKSHAWVEVGGVVVSDKPYMHEIYRELERC